MDRRTLPITFFPLLSTFSVQLWFAEIPVLSIFFPACPSIARALYIWFNSSSYFYHSPRNCIWSLLTHYVNFDSKSKKIAINFKLFKDKQTLYYIFAIVLLTFFVLVGEIKSFPRYTSTLFPFLWANSLWINDNHTKFFLISTLYTSLMVLGTLLFTNSYPFI